MERDRVNLRGANLSKIGDDYFSAGRSRQERGQKRYFILGMESRCDRIVFMLQAQFETR